MNAATWRFSMALGVLLLSTTVYAQSASFTYQGQLRQSGEPFTGMADLEFRLYDQFTGGSQIGSTQSVSEWPVEDGLFQVELNFGATAFDGGDRFLEVTVDGAPLIPRQKITATPYALLASGLASGSVGSSSVDPTEVQLRVVGTCPVGEYIQEVNQDGSVICGVDEDSGGTLTQVDTGTGLTGGPITDTGTISVAPGGIGTAEIDISQVQARVSGSCPAGLFLQQVNQDGTVVCAADTIGNDWRLGGNAGTNPATDFLGTTDAAAFEIRTNSARSLRIEPSTETFNGSPITTNTVSGASANGVAPGVRGATISGGGVPTGDSDPAYPAENPNQVTDHYGTVGGGYGNTAGDDSGSVDDRVSAIVAGGIDNHASGSLSAIGGGLGNRASGSQSTIGGGILNTATEAEGTVSGGRSNNATGRQSSISGGEWNAASGDRSAIGGGSNNAASGPDSTIGGGSQNSALVSYSTVAGGSLNEAGGIYSALGGGSLNLASGAYSNVSGGRDNEATGERSGVGGGGSNQAGGGWSRVSGGASNTADGAFSTVGGGEFNQAIGPDSTISGGRNHLAGGSMSTVGGGQSNRATGIWSTVGGGDFNQSSGKSGTVSGGSGNCAGGDNSWAGGYRAKVRPATGASFPVDTACHDVPTSPDSQGDEGTFVWADFQFEDFVSTGPDQFLVRAVGGVGLGTNAPQAQLHVTEALNGSADSPGNHVAIIENTAKSTGNGPDVLALKTSVVDPDSSDNLITFFDGNDDAIGAIQGNNAGGIVFASGGADFAEWLAKRDPMDVIEPGDIVGWHADGISHETEGALRVMAVSTQPIVAGNAPPDGAEHNWARVGFIGQVPVRVRGPVEAGDWIVASGLDDGTGVAVRADALLPTQLGRVVGQALESAVHEGERLINVAIGLGHERALGGSVARLQAQNETLRHRLAAMESRQASEIASLREELALLRSRTETQATPVNLTYLETHPEPGDRP